MERHQELYGAREPSDARMAPIHAHFYEQVNQVPRLDGITQWCEILADPPGTGMRSYQWLLWQVELLMMRIVRSGQSPSTSRPAILEIDRLALAAG
eukprot:5715574-Pyramimonas_sp.AAC.1